jgi:integrase
MRLFKPTYKDRQGRTQKATKWYVEVRDHLEQVRRLPGFTDKAQTEELGRKLSKLVSARSNSESPEQAMGRWLENLPRRIRSKLVEIGLIEGHSGAAMKTLTEHLADFADHLRAKGITSKQVHMVHQRAGDLFKGCGAMHWSQVQPTPVERWLAELMTKPRKGSKAKVGGPGRSVQSRNFYLQAAKQFCRWMVREGRATQNPLEHQRAMNVATDRRHDRRALSIDELRRLLAVTFAGSERFGLTGRERSLVYRLSAEPGLRASELRSLTRASFTFGRKLASVTVEAGNSKRRRRDELPMRADTAALVRDHVAHKSPNAQAFNLTTSDETANMLRADLADARAAWLAESQTPEDGAERERSAFLVHVDDAGRHVDFHALRHTFMTNLARAGVHPATAQRLARHSDVRLTLGRYTHINLDEQREALETLPDLSDFGQQTGRATGTDGRETIDPRLAFCLARNDAFQSNSVHSCADDTAAANVDANEKNPREDRDKPAILGDCEAVHPRGLEPLTFGSVDRCSIQLS